MGMSSRSRALPHAHALEPRTLLSYPPQPWAEQEVSFDAGAIVADPHRNMAYLADVTNNHLVAIDTDQARSSGTVNLASSPERMAVSVDDNRLFVAEPEGKKIEVFSLPNLTLLKTLNVAHGPYQIACGAGERLYISSYNSTSYGWPELYQIDANT